MTHFQDLLFRIALVNLMSQTPFVLFTQVNLLDGQLQTLSLSCKVIQDSKVR